VHFFRRRHNKIYHIFFPIGLITFIHHYNTQLLQFYDRVEGFLVFG